MTASTCLLALAAFAQSAQQTPFCRDYQAVLAQAYRGFRAFRGVIESDENRPDDQTYRSTYALPGGTCKISEDEFEFSYNCSWELFDPDDWQGAINQTRALATALAQCSNRPMVEIGESESGSSKRWRGLVSFPYPSRTKVEVTAANFAPNSRALPRRMSFVRLAVTYRRETHP